MDAQTLEIKRQKQPELPTNYSELLVNMFLCCLSHVVIFLDS